MAELLPDFCNTEGNSFTSDFSYLYKNSGKNPKLSQQERREILLKEQKEKRHNFVDGFRDGLRIFSEEENVDFSEHVEEPEKMVVEQNPNQKRSMPFHFMKSEWFMEIPDDFEDNWLVKLVPEGFRVLIVARKHNTIVSNRKGRVVTLKTNLPGGGLDKGHGLTVLDGIYNKTTKTIFILDCLYWNTMSLLDSETNFRFYWLKNKFDENCKLSETSKAHKLQVLDFLPAQRPIIQDKIFDTIKINNKQILFEGITFYHKEVHYIFGQTPLLGWLFTYMLPKILGIDVPVENMAKMPDNVNSLQDLEHKKIEKKSWKEKRVINKSKMDTT